MNEENLPLQLIENRAKWQFNGSVRPDFADEPKANQTSVWDFPRPPKIVLETDHFLVKNNNEIIAQSNKVIAVCETANPPCYYFPENEVNLKHLMKIEKESWCEWKGKTQFWVLKENPDLIVAWSYPNPFTAYTEIRDYIAFYPQNLECYVNKEKAITQDSLFYAGWITSNYSGPFKGKKGTELW